LRAAEEPSLLESRVGWLRQQGNVDRMRGCLRGIEKESLRITADGQLAKTPHPRAFGSALTNPYLTTDYSEALLEFVTPPHASNWETLQFLCDLHSFVYRGLGDELLWPASMPCIGNLDADVPIADYGRSNAGMLRTVYRRGLGFRYGRAMQAIAGAHFNFSLPDEFWEVYREWQNAAMPMSTFKSAQMMGLVRNYRRCAWLVVYLFGASPAVCKSFRPEAHELLAELDSRTWFAPYATSLRMSDIGYRNSTQARLTISANSVDEYVAGLTAAVTTVDPRYAAIGVRAAGEFRQLNANILQIENEYYSSVRPKPRNRAIRPIVALRRDGVEYVEVRTLDLNVADPVGVNQAQMRFLEALLIRCLLAESPPISAAEQEEIDARDIQVAREGRRPGLRIRMNGDLVGLREAGLELLRDVAITAALLERGSSDYADAVEAARTALEDPGRTPSAKLIAELRSGRVTFFEYVLELARGHREYFLSLPLDPAKERMLAAVAVRSVADAEALEAQDDVPFEEYLRRYSELQ
jgi:glutamate--cysteine ligase